MGDRVIDELISATADRDNAKLCSW